MLEIILIIKELKEENFKHGGIYYHHKAIDKNDYNRDILIEKKKKDKRNKVYKMESDFLSENFLINTKNKAKENINFYNKKEKISQSPFNDIINKLDKDEDLINTDETLHGDMIIMLPFDSMLSYNKYSKTIDKLSMIVIKLESNIFIGFITFKKLIDEITKFYKKVEVIDYE